MRMLFALPLFCGMASIAQASLTLVPTSPASHAGNLVVNGSFENTTGGGPPGAGPANWRLWATGTALTAPPFAVPTGWTSSGNINSYAMWGNDGTLTMRNSDILPHGEYALYFGNGGMATVNLAPTFNPDGSVGFSGTPTITQDPAYPTPVTLMQTIPTSTNPAPKYCISFWISSEGADFASDPNADAVGIFGFRATNVLTGDPVQFLTVPSAVDNPWGKSIRFDYEFVPLNTSQDVSIEFINYGHFDLTAHGRGSTTELVLDDVMVNTIVPEPATFPILLGAAVFGTQRRKQSRIHS